MNADLKSPRAAQSLRAAVVKLGGSIVTDKGSETLRVNQDRVRNLAFELREAKLERLVLVSGAGSYGHRIVAKTGIDTGINNPQDLLAWAETQRLQYVLSATVAKIFIDAGLPVIVHQASASARLQAGKLRDMDTQVCQGILQLGAIPLLYGVPAWDQQQGCAILSGDQLAPFIALKLGIPDLVYGTDVDGVYDRPPAQAGAMHIPLITNANFAEVQKSLSGSRHVDVTGGMAGKISTLMDWADQGLRARIIDATIPGRISQALAGEDVGTLCCAKESCR